ncbi:MAG: hypothetical protein HYX78_00650 [Armatimonadetes bacterium]|nr:hypothetical protein [Armatimonadota bacterium]
MPVSLRATMSAAKVIAAGPCEDVRALGSYWPRRTDLDVQSQLVKYFKSPDNLPLNKPCMTAVVRAYASMLSEIAADWRPNAVVRVLSSGETRPDPQKPISLLARLVSERLGALDFTHIFFRTEPRKPMRMIDRFAGPNVLRQRIGYVLQDLFLVPCKVGPKVLLIDDIYNLGATAAVYSAAIKQYCGSEHVYSANIAAARFHGGKDGWGKLHLDIDRLLELARGFLSPRDPADSLDDVWLERSTELFHLRPDCSAIAGPTCRSVRFLVPHARTLCLVCGRRRTPHDKLGHYPKPRNE